MVTLAVAFGLASAVGFGISDFLGGYAGRRLGVLPVLVVGQAAGLVVLAVAAVLVPSTPPAIVDLAWGAVAGVGAVAGALLLLRGFEIGRIGVVSPVSSLGAAALPLAADLLVGARLTSAAATGVALGLVAIWLVSAGDGADASAGGSGLGYGLGAGIGFAVTYLALARTDPDSGAWPVLALQIVLVGLGAALALARRQPLAVPRGLRVSVAGHGITGAIAVLAFLLAARAGLVSVAAVIASMSPAVTVVLARVVLAEHLSVRRAVGIAVALVALALLDVG